MPWAMILSIVYNFSFCCELRRCRESPTSIFLLFLHESAYLANWEIILQISKIFKFRIFLYFSTNRRIW